MKKILLIAAILLSGLSSSFASHIPGGNLTWACTGNPNEFLVTIQMFVSCPNGLSTVSVTANMTNTCGLANPSLVLPLLPSTPANPNPKEVSQICDRDTAQSDCITGVSGGIPGVKMYTYQALVTLPDTCDSWDFYYSICCRDASSNLSGTNSNTMYFHSQMNSGTAPCDASPYVTAQPIPYVCMGVQQTYCPGAIDPDGDSLYYSLVSPLGATATPIAHLGGYGPTTPLQNLTLDPVTGCITFTQNAIGNYVVTYKIEAFDAAGNQTGFIYHDFQIEVINNANCQVPTPLPGGITNAAGSAIITSNNTIEICEGQSFCFDLTFTDPDPLDTLKLDSANTNIFAALPGATVTSVGQNPVTFTICWTVPAVGLGPNTQASIGVTDGSCPIENLANFPLIINVINSTVVNEPDTICGNQSSQFTAAGGNNFTWYYTATGVQVPVGPEFSCNPCANPIVSPIALGTTDYYVISDLVVGCNSSDSTSITKVADFTPTAYGDTLLCDFLPRQIGVNVTPAAAGYTYLWDNGASLTSDVINNPIATPTQTTSYIATVTSPLACVKQDTVTVSVSPPPSVTLVPGDTTICAGQSAQFDVSLTAVEDDFTTAFDPAVWSSVTGATVGAPCVPYNGTALNFNSANRELITNSANVASCTSIDFCLWIANNISSSTGCENADAGEDVQLSYSVNGPAGPWVIIQTFATGDWDAGGPYANAWQCFSIPIPAGAATANTSFKWEQIGWYGGTIDNWALDDIAIMCGGNNNYTYNWTPPAGLDDPTINNPIATPNATTVYTVTLTDTGGCTVDRMQTVTVTGAYTITTTPNDTTICLGEAINFEVTPSLPAAYTYAWSHPNFLNDTTIANPIGTFTSPGSYDIMVDVELPGCAIVSDTITVTVLKPVIPAVSITAVSCKDQGDGKITITPNFGPGSEVQSFVWTDSISGAILQNTNNLTTGMQDSLINLTPGAYTITMSDTTGCSTDTTVWVTEPDSVQIDPATITADATICIDGSMNIDAPAIGGNGAPYTYVWTNLNTNTVIPGNGPHNVSPTDKVTCYSVSATDFRGCISNTDQVCITLNDSVVATAANDTIFICQNTSATLNISAVGGNSGPYNYEWSENGTTISSTQSFTVTPTQQLTQYVGSANDGCNPIAYDTTYVKWLTPVIPSFVRLQADSCYPITVDFVNTSTPLTSVDPLTVQWSSTNGTSSNGTTFTSTFNSAVCQDVTLSFLTVDGCVVDTTYTNFVCPHDYPVANFDMTPPVTDLLNTEIDFTNLSTGSNLSYLWNFNSGLTPDSSTSTNPTFTYPSNAPGSYTATLTVTDSPNGCVSTVEGTVIINSIYLFYVPNSFTPDNDGLNDVFRAYGDGIDLSSYSLQIFDRWGELLFETSNATNGWNGKYKNEYVEAGTYVWKIVAKDDHGTVIHDNFGHVNIIR